MKEDEKAIKAARSYERNLVLKPRVEERLDKARSVLESYLMLNGGTSVQLGGYKIELHNGELLITRLPPEGWEQLEMRGLCAEQSPTDDRERQDHET